MLHFSIAEEDHTIYNAQKPSCLAWCCGCDVHPIGKPWGWNSHAWEKHYEEHHSWNRFFEPQKPEEELFYEP